MLIISEYIRRPKTYSTITFASATDQEPTFHSFHYLWIFLFFQLFYIKYISTPIQIKALSGVVPDWRVNQLNPISFVMREITKIACIQAHKLIDLLFWPFLGVAGEKEKATHFTPYNAIPKIGTPGLMWLRG